MAERIISIDISHLVRAALAGDAPRKTDAAPRTDAGSPPGGREAGESSVREVSGREGHSRRDGHSRDGHSGERHSREASDTRRP